MRCQIGIGGEIVDAGKIRIYGMAILRCQRCETIGARAPDNRGLDASPAPWRANPKADALLRAPIPAVQRLKQNLADGRELVNVLVTIHEIWRGSPAGFE